MYNAHSSSPSMWPLSLEQIIPFENSGIPQRSYLAFWYENTDGDEVCKIPIWLPVCVQSHFQMRAHEKVEEKAIWK